MSKKYAIICNPSSGSAVPPEELTKFFTAGGVEAHVMDVKLGIDELSRRIHKLRPDVVVASGGDGTVNTVANVAVQTDTVMAALPTGTFNHFTKDIKVPHILADSIEIALHGEVQALDYATVNGYVFVNSSSLGAYPQAVLAREDLRSSLSKMTAMAVAVIKVARANRNMHLVFEMDGKKFAVKTPSVFIGNNPFTIKGPGVPVRNRLRDGLLGVYVLKAGRFRELLYTGARLITGGVHEKLRIYTTQHVRITSDKMSTDISLDGEIATMDFPLDYMIHPQALRVMVPVGRKDGFDV